MAKKKGRPPKSPSPHPSPTPNSIPKNLDLLNLDDEDLEDIEDLSPKKAGDILKKLDELRAKIKGKAIVVEAGEGMTTDVLVVTNTAQNSGNQGLDPKTKEGIIPEANIELATEAVKEALQEKCVEEDGEISVVKETQLEGMDKEQEGQMEKDQTDQPWTPVMTRRKGQYWSLEEEGDWRNAKCLPESAQKLHHVKVKRMLEMDKASRRSEAKDKVHGQEASDSSEIAIGPAAVVSLLLSSLVQKVEDHVANPHGYNDYPLCSCSVIAVILPGTAS
ncbi:hypothetical protein RIF29_01919 [Crotalaria pallida]|uniref:Uncharacterized protein n=1 Tax=Crotalaria pallida TaxID=3830 RepID=A0AAN9IZZ6_CROPI